MKIYAEIITTDLEEHTHLLKFLQKIKVKVIREDTSLVELNNNTFSQISVMCDFQQWLDIKASELYSRTSFQVKK